MTSRRTHRLLAAAVVFFSAAAFAQTDLVGSWLFTKIKSNQGSQEQRLFMPAPDTDLVLTFDFEASGMNRLRWTRKGERAFCERQGQYRYNGQTLEDLIVWVHPGNAPACAQDPEMRLGNFTQSPAEIIDGKLELSLRVGDQAIIYLWERRSP